jgi:hypothetical protein
MELLPPTTTTTTTTANPRNKNTVAVAATYKILCVASITHHTAIPRGAFWCLDELFMWNIGFHGVPQSPPPTKKQSRIPKSCCRFCLWSWQIITFWNMRSHLPCLPAHRRCKCTRALHRCCCLPRQVKYTMLCTSP